MTAYIEKLKTLWNEWGWAPEFILSTIGIIMSAIAVKKWGLNIVVSIWNKIKINKNASDGMENFTKRRINYSQWLQEIKQTTRIAFVDDEPHFLPIEELRSAGYNVQKFTSVSLAEIDNLREYDVVFLDIAGVVEDDFENGGFSILTRLTDESHDRRPFVIAITGQTYNVDRSRFFEYSDDRIDKPISASQCEDLIRNAISPFIASEELDILINDVCLSPRMREKTLRILISYLSGNVKWSKVEYKLNQLSRPDLYDIKRLSDRIKRWINLHSRI